MDVIQETYFAHNMKRFLKTFSNKIVVLAIINSDKFVESVYITYIFGFR